MTGDDDNGVGGWNKAMINNDDSSAACKFEQFSADTIFGGEIVTLRFLWRKLGTGSDTKIIGDEQRTRIIENKY